MPPPGVVVEFDDVERRAVRALAEFGNVLGDGDRAQLERDLAECKQAVESGGLEDVRSALVRLEASAQKIGELIYAQAGGG